MTGAHANLLRLVVRWQENLVDLETVRNDLRRDDPHSPARVAAERLHDEAMSFVARLVDELESLDGTAGSR